MKALITAVLITISFPTFSSEMGAVDSLTSILPVSSYKGMDDKNNVCAVEVNEVNFPAKAVTVTVSNNKNKIFKIINDDSEFLFRAYKQEYIQTDRQYVDATRNAFVERIIRTVNAGENRLYVIVANEVTVNREVIVEAVECVVDLK